MRFRIESEIPTFAGFPIRYHSRSLDDHFGAWRSLIADHRVRPGSAARWPDQFAIHTLRNDHPLAGLQHLRRPVDGAERSRLRARPTVVRILRLAIHVVGFRKV